MACEQRIRTCQKAQLLPNTVTTEQQSLMVVKKLLAIAVSCITYLRGLFPEKAYGSKYVEEQKVMILREERSCPGATQIVQWMHGCFDALQKKYLRMVVLSIYTEPDNPQKVTECYQFKIRYTDSGAQMDLESHSDKKLVKMGTSDTRKASILLVRKLYTLMQNLGPLPDNVYINMKLSYYDEVTPQEYQPPGFKEGDSDNMMFEKEPVHLTMGEVVTPFHTLKVDVMTEKERLEQIDDERIEGEKRLMLEDIQEAKQVAVMKDPQLEVETDVPEGREVCATMEKSQVVCETRKTTEVNMSIKTTRSGRKISSAYMKKKEKPGADTEGQFTFPVSQEEVSVPKKRKFSEPKERY